eukprot:COSAG06_NODE_12159_length_1416_cov_1.179195_1_plen_86_part_10
MFECISVQNYGHPIGCKSPCKARDMSAACHECMRDGYYRAISHDGIHWTDDVAHNPGAPTTQDAAVSMYGFLSSRGHTNFVVRLKK